MLALVVAIPETAENTRTGAKVTTGGAQVKVNPFVGTMLLFVVENNILLLFAFEVTALAQLQVVPAGTSSVLRLFTLVVQVVELPLIPTCDVIPEPPELGLGTVHDP